MTKQFQPLTIQVTTTPRRLRTQLLAAWPQAPHASRCARAIKTITHHINDTLPSDYKGDISVFLSNEADSIHEPVYQGFLYNLTDQQIVTRQPVKKTNNTALLHVHFTTAQNAQDNEDELENKETTPVSRIEQIKQWQQETVKAMFQAMADTALSMEAQTSLRGAMAGLNKLGALLNQAKAAHKLPQSHAKVVVQKTAARDIATTLSDLRSNLTLASSNGLKPPTKAQLALRKQINKLDKLSPPSQKTLVKSAPKSSLTADVKTKPITKSAPTIKTQVVKARIATARALPTPVQAKVVPARIVKITIAPLRLTTVAKTYMAPRAALQATQIRVLPRRVITPPRLIANLAARIAAVSANKPTQRFTASTTKAIITKIAQRPVVASPAVQLTLVTTRTTPRFQINRAFIVQLRVTPTTIAAYQNARSAISNVQLKAEQTKVEKPTQPEKAEPKTNALPTARNTTQSLGSKIPLHNTRAPATYAIMGQIISPIRHQTVQTKWIPASPAITPLLSQRSAVPAQTAPQARLETTHTAPSDFSPASFAAPVILTKVQTENIQPAIVNQSPTQPDIHRELAQPFVQPSTNPTIITPAEAQPLQPAQPINFVAEKQKSGEPVEPATAKALPPERNQAKPDAAIKSTDPSLAKPIVTTPIAPPAKPVAGNPIVQQKPIIPTAIAPIEQPEVIKTSTTVVPTQPAPPPPPINPIKPAETPTNPSNVLPFRQPDKSTDRPSDQSISDRAVPSGDVVAFRTRDEIKRPVAYDSTRALKDAYVDYVKTEGHWVGRAQAVVNAVSGGRVHFNNSSNTDSLFTDPILPTQQQEKNPVRKLFSKTFHCECG